MKYYAMIDGERCGPFALDQLSEAGVRPDTYVWCKGMADWEKAEDVADICRHFRQRIFDLMHPQVPRREAPAERQDESRTEGTMPMRYQRIIREYGGDTDEPPRPGDEPMDTTRPPAPTLILAIFLTLFCFPLTGFVAIYYSYKARRTWEDARRSDTANNRPLYSDAEREHLRKEAHDFNRQAKMWIGITFFLGMIVYAFLGRSIG